MALTEIGFGQDIYNILFSAEGLVPKTHQASASMATMVDNELLLKQGALYTDPISGQIGVVGDTYAFAPNEVKPISVVIAGHLLSERVTAEVVAQEEALREQGLYLH